jgi:O-succinylbenzoic acid--CoA ligase
VTQEQETARRPVRLLAVAAGVAGVRAVLDDLPAAISGDGPALGLAPSGDSEHSRRGREAVMAGGSDVDADVAVVIATSGSTGAPRGVMLPAAALLASAHAAIERLGGPGAWTLALPVTSVGGLQVVVRSLVAGVEPLVLSSVGGAGRFDPAEFARLTWRLDPSLPAYTSIVPAQAAVLVDHADGLAALRAYEAVLLGGARTPGPLLARLRAEQVAAIPTYGMTETSGGMVYDGVALGHVGVTVLDPDEHGVGRLGLTGATIARGYLGDEDATRERFVDGMHLTSDLGRLRDGVLEVIGRLDDVVQVGGVNVAVAAVEDLLISACADACVLAVPDERWGARLTAYVVAGPDDATLKTLVVDALGRPALPRTWVRLDAIPHLPNGKPDRDALRTHT